MRRPTLTRQDQRGFTILELMIATAVLSTILLLATVMMINIGNLYYKGVNQARVQDGTRSVVDEVAKHIEFSDAHPTPVSHLYSGITVQAYCIDTTRYSYVVGRQIGTGTDTNGVAQVRHILWRDTIATGSCVPADDTVANPSAATGGTNGTELIPPNSRVTAFSVTGTPPTGTSPYNISLEVAYGNIDLLSGATGMNVTCRGQVGDKFCATASLTTTVAQRLTP